MKVFLSIVVPVFNEEVRIRSFVDQMRGYLSTTTASWEIVVVDDGSRDGTKSTVEELARADPRIRLLAGPHKGKGDAVRRGMLAAQGEWRFMADADLAMPPDNLARFLVLVNESHPPDLVIGSREAPGSQRLDEPWVRHWAGRLFNLFVRAVAVPGVRDTQCGFKLFRAPAAELLFSRSATQGFAFDVETLLLAKRAGLDVREVGVVWRGSHDSRVAIARGATAFIDVIRIRWRWRNKWAGGTLCLALLLAMAIAFGLARVPIQVSDSLAEILEAQSSPSAAASFADTFRGVAYLRPLRIAQIKALFDLADGNYNYRLVYRGFHALLLVSLLVLFSSCLRVKDALDFAAAAFAFVVLCGLHTFLGFVREAFPINHFLEIAVLCVAALRLAQSRGGWLADVGGALLLIVGALTLESGLLVWVVIAAAWLSGLRGISTRGLVLSTGVCVAYFGLRFLYLDVGVPLLAERSSGFLLERLEPDELESRFGAAPVVFYLYNVVASVMSVLLSEPKAGVLIATREWLAGEVLPRTYLAVLSSLATTVLIGVWAVVRCRARRLDSMPDRLAAVALAVILANGVLSFAYTKDEVMAVGGVFYAFAAYSAMRATLSWARTLRPSAVLVVAVLLSGLTGAWAVRTAAVDHTLRVQAFKERNDWADVMERLARNGHPQTRPAAVALIERLRREALDAPVPNPGLLPEWHNRWLGE